MADRVAMDFNPWVKNEMQCPSFGRKTINFPTPISAKTQARVVQHFTSESTSISSGQKFTQNRDRYRIYPSDGKAEINGIRFWREINCSATIPAAKTKPRCSLLSMGFATLHPWLLLLNPVRSWYTMIYEITMNSKQSKIPARWPIGVST